MSTGTRQKSCTSNGRKRSRPGREGRSVKFRTSTLRDDLKPGIIVLLIEYYRKKEEEEAKK